MTEKLKFYKHYILTSEHAYTLENWKEIEEWHKLPFYKKWFIKKPIKELKRLNQNKDLDQMKNNQYNEQGQRHGLWEWEDGILKYKVNYFNDELHGLYESYYLDGKLYSKGNYLDGKSHGLWKWYNEDGSLSYEGNYLDGKLKREYNIQPKSEKIRKKLASMGKKSNNYFN